MSAMRKVETAANTAVSFTVEDWSLLRSLVKEFSGLAKELRAYMESSEKRHAAAEASVASAHKRLDRLDKKWVWASAFGAGFFAFGAGAWAFIKFAWPSGIAALKVKP